MTKSPKPLARPGSSALARMPSSALVPLYRRVSESLLREIAAGRIRAGEALPTEDALCTGFGVSRITVRKALDELAERNLIVRRRGVGTFVCDPPTAARSVTLTGFIEEMLSPNRLVIVREGSVRPPAHVAEFAKLAPDARLRLFEGTNHLAGGEPLVHLHYYYPTRFAKRLTAGMLSGATPPIKVLERTFGIQVDHAEQVVEADIARGRVARRLGIARGTPVLRALRVYYDIRGEPVEIFDAVYHPQHYRYTARLYPRPRPPDRASPRTPSTRSRRRR